MSNPSENEFESALTYSSYLAVDELLGLQRPLSEGPEHDEMLFIIIHQTYELWFKQLIHEFTAAQQSLEDGDGRGPGRDVDHIDAYDGLGRPHGPTRIPDIKRDREAQIHKPGVGDIGGYAAARVLIGIGGLPGQVRQRGGEGAGVIARTGGDL